MTRPPPSTDHSRSLWSSNELDMPTLQPLVGDTHADVCIVGAGIAGLSTAWCLLQAGHSVLVVERDGIAAGETGRTSAHLSSALDDRFRTLESWFGAEGARLAGVSHAAAIDWIETWSQELRIDCDFQRIDGHLFAPDGSNEHGLHLEHEATQRLGLETEFKPRGVEGLPRFGAALTFPRQARFQPLRYLAGLARAILERGGRIVQGTAERVNGGELPEVYLTDGSRIEASSVVVAANVPFHERVALHTRQAAYRTYVVTAPVPRGSVPDALIWDDDDPYHYVRLAPLDAQHDLLIVGGADHKTGQPESDVSPYDSLYTWAQAHFEGLGARMHTWSGQVIEPVDGLGFIGRDPGGLENVYVVSGDSGHGLTHGTLAGPLLTALIGGETHPWEAIYSPQRKHFGGAGNWLHENLNVALQYGDWLAAGGARSVDELQPEQGAIVRHGLHRLAVFRDAQGCVHAHSAVCPHLGGSVRWNADQKSFDCPCHGSRFDARDGRVLNGPAVSGLAPTTLPERDTQQLKETSTDAQHDVHIQPP